MAVNISPLSGILAIISSHSALPLGSFPLLLETPFLSITSVAKERTLLAYKIFDNEHFMSLSCKLNEARIII